MRGRAHCAQNCRPKHSRLAWPVGYTSPALPTNRSCRQSIALPTFWCSPRSTSRSEWWLTRRCCAAAQSPLVDRKSTRLNSSHLVISYAVFCLKKKKSKAHHCECQHTRRLSLTESQR